MNRRLLINGRFLGGGRTAVNTVAHELTNALCRESGGWQVEVIVPPVLSEVPSHWPIRETGRFKGILWEQHDLPKLAGQGVIAGFFNTVPLSGRGYVTLLHDAHVFTTPQSYGTKTRLWRQMLSRRAGATGNHVLSVSEHAVQNLRDHGIGEAGRMGVVHNGVGAVGRVTSDGQILERLGLGKDQPYYLGLATLLAHKNIGVLIDAFADPRLAKVKLVLFGTATRNAFEGAGHYVSPNIVFAGPVSDAELAALYGAALATCMPSTAEGFGLPALESMALGRPAIIAPCGALPEVVGDTGLRAAPDDPHAWADAVRRLVDDPALHARLSKAAQKRAAAFTWDAAAQTVLGHLDRWYPA